MHCVKGQAGSTHTRLQFLIQVEIKTLKRKLKRTTFRLSFYGFHHILQLKKGRIRIVFEAIKLHCKMAKYRVSRNYLQPFRKFILKQSSKLQHRNSHTLNYNCQSLFCHLEVSGMCAIGNNTSLPTHFEALDTDSAPPNPGAEFV
jgi:hypothetical protein